MKKTRNRVGTGGSIERDLVRRWARRRMANGTRGGSDLIALLQWLDKQPARTKQRGGIGR